MIILAIKTDQPRAYLGVYDDYEPLAQLSWEGHRELGISLFHKLDDVLREAGVSLDSINGVVCYDGPGSFTGLRIGLTCGNTLAYANSIPIVAKREQTWLEKGVDALLSGENDKIAMPYYGADAHITQPKK